jgi:hypothetical protein
MRVFGNARNGVAGGDGQRFVCEKVSHDIRSSVAAAG